METPPDPVLTESAIAAAVGVGGIFPAAAAAAAAAAAEVAAVEVGAVAAAHPSEDSGVTREPNLVDSKVLTMWKCENLASDAVVFKGQSIAVTQVLTDVADSSLTVLKRNPITTPKCKQQTPSLLKKKKLHFVI
jgi:hypothetical protein